MNIYKVIASFFGIGFIKKGGGTVASLIICILLYLSVLFDFYSNVQLIIFSIVTLFIGIVVSNEAEKSWGKDSNKIVIDEVLGMAIGLLFLPINLQTLIIGFVLFRFFDIAKPLYIKRLEKFGSGWGVMLDDVLAGIYTNVVIQILLVTHLIK